MNYVNKATLDIDGKIVHCKSIKPKCDLKLEPVLAMTPNGVALGWNEGAREYELGAEISMPPGGHEVDFFSLWKDGTEFTATINYLNGKYVTYLQCRISSIEEPAEEGKSVDTNLSIKALDAFEG